MVYEPDSEAISMGLDDGPQEHLPPKGDSFDLRVDVDFSQSILDVIIWVGSAPGRDYFCQGDRVRVGTDLQKFGINTPKDL